MKLSENKINFRPQKILPTALILLLILGIFAALFVYAHEEKTDGVQPTDYAEYETGTVLQILTDSCEADEVAEGAYRGNQTLLVEVTSGQYKGETLLVTNAVGPMYGEPAAVGQSIVMTVSTYSDGSHTASSMNTTGRRSSI